MDNRFPSAGHVDPAKRALVVSDDQIVAAELQSYLEEDHGCRVRLTGNFEHARQLVAENGLTSLFLDLRFLPSTQSPIPLLEQIADGKDHPIGVAAIMDDGYVRDWAALAEKTIHGRVRLPLDRRQVSQLVESELARGAHACHRPLLPKVVQSEHHAFKTHTPELFQTLDHLVLMAAHEVTLLLVGETGSGKTTLARLVHELSPRREQKLLTVACGALPPDLIESELFGHLKGAFTGADRTKIGKFEAADRGTLLLDEIDVLGPNQQTKLLRVIETGEFEPVGSNETRRSDARLIVASNVDLKGMMEANDFRPDLYYRLNVMEFVIPPLRKRPLDIVPLTLDFIDEFCLQHGMTVDRIHPDFMDCIKAYHWPGNIRELKNHVRRAVLFCRNGELTSRDLAPCVAQAVLKPRTGAAPVRLAETLSEKVADSERDILEKALRAHEFKRTATAQALGISRVGLYKKMKKYGMLDRQHRRETPQRDAS